MTAYEACPGVDEWRAGIERIAAEDPFAAHGLAGYVITTPAPGRVRPALAPLLTQDG